MRAMLLDYQDDPIATELWDQYLLGRDLLVAPVIEEGATARKVYLPRGRWWHLFEQRWYDAGWHQIAAPLESIPVFMREGAVLPLGFDSEIRFGSTMRSGINDPRHRLDLVAGQRI
jgi:alpha-D-xyloside xylohydrolase